MSSPPEPGRLPSDSLQSLPRRAFLASPRRPPVDGHGFVLPLPGTEALSASDLLLCSAALVVAPPWTGKTFVSDQLDNALNLAEKLHRKVNLERSAPSLKPPWCSMSVAAVRAGSAKRCTSSPNTRVLAGPFDSEFGEASRAGTPLRSSILTVCGGAGGKRRDAGACGSRQERRSRILRRSSVPR